MLIFQDIFNTDEFMSDIFPFTLEYDDCIMKPNTCQEFITEIYHLADDRDMSRFEKLGDDDFSFAIAGVSGNGQMEIADIITGIIQDSTGEIVLDGEDISKLSIDERIKRGISYVPEDRHAVALVLDETLEDNIVLKKMDTVQFLKKIFLRRNEISTYADMIIDKYDVRSGQGRSTIVRSMSGGNQQKAIIGREIELDAKLLIFVQPTRGLDVGAIENIWKLILKERDRGKAVLLISLELEEIMNLADTVGVIYNGHIDKIASRDQLTEREIGSYMMGVKHNE